MLRKGVNNYRTKEESSPEGKKDMGRDKKRKEGNKVSHASCSFEFLFSFFQTITRKDGKKAQEREMKKRRKRDEEKMKREGHQSGSEMGRRRSSMNAKLPGVPASYRPLLSSPFVELQMPVLSPFEPYCRTVNNYWQSRAIH
jgi:hypothetical protein